MKLIIFVLTCLASVAYGQQLPAPMTAEENLARGRELYNANSFHQAIPFFQEAVRLSPAMQDGLYYLGVTYRYIMDYSRAIEQFKKLESVNPNYFAWFYYEEGVAYE